MADARQRKPGAPLRAAPGPGRPGLRRPPPRGTRLTRPSPRTPGHGWGLLFERGLSLSRVVVLVPVIVLAALRHGVLCLRDRRVVRSVAKSWTTRS